MNQKEYPLIKQKYLKCGQKTCFYLIQKPVNIFIYDFSSSEKIYPRFYKKISLSHFLEPKADWWSQSFQGEHLSPTYFAAEHFQ